MKFHLPARLTAEFVGSMFLVAAVIGSGIMAERLKHGQFCRQLSDNRVFTGVLTGLEKVNGLDCKSRVL